jgi:hypothetical protein
MAVLLDGPAWARRGTVGDRDGLPVEVLGEMLRWPVVERVWLPEWLVAPDAVVDRLVAAVDGLPLMEAGNAVSLHAEPPSAEVVPFPAAAVESFKGVAALRTAVTAVVEAPVPPAPPAKPALKGAPTPAVKPAVKPAPKPARPAGLDGESAFKPWGPKTAGEKSVLDELPAAKSARAVRKVLTAGVKAEGPIHVDRLLRLTAGAFGLGRVTDSRKAALLSTLPPSAVVDDYLWPDGVDRVSWSGFRRQATSGERPLEHVAPEEIGNAMAALCRASFGMQRDELLTQAAAVFGVKRRTPTTQPALEAALAKAVEAGKLAEQPSGLVTAV